MTLIPDEDFKKFYDVGFTVCWKETGLYIILSNSVSAVGHMEYDIRFPAAVYTPGKVRISNFDYLISDGVQIYPDRRTPKIIWKELEIELRNMLKDALKNEVSMQCLIMQIFGDDTLKLGS